MRKPVAGALALAALLLALLAPAPGCVERRLEVKTDPPDAVVTVDGRELARATPGGPAVLAYEHYGIRSVVVRREGMKAQDRLVTLDPPWWQVFPLDFVTDVLVPWKIEDVREESFVLRPREDLETSDGGDEGRRRLLERARAAADESERHP